MMTGWEDLFDDDDGMRNSNVFMRVNGDQSQLVFCGTTEPTGFANEE